MSDNPHKFRTIRMFQSFVSKFVFVHFLDDEKMESDDAQDSPMENGD